MGRFRMFTDAELDIMESALCNEGLLYLIDEVRLEKRSREKEKQVLADCGYKDWYRPMLDIISEKERSNNGSEFND